MIGRHAATIRSAGLQDDGRMMVVRPRRLERR
jgi:hypothetical protein